MNAIRTGTAITALLFVSLSVYAAGGNRPDSAIKEVRVKCDQGQTLQAAIDRADRTARPLAINFTGTCTENLSIGRSRLAIDGAGAGRIVGQVRNFGANITLRNLTITGPGVGYIASGGRTRLLDVHFVDNEEQGIAISGNGMVFFRNGSITSSGLEGVAVKSGTLEASNVQIAENGSGIQATMAQISLENADVVRNRGRGIDASMNSALRLVAGTFNENDGAGLVVDNSSSIYTEGVDVSWNGSSGISVRFNSAADIVDSTFSHNGQGGGFGSGAFVSTSSSATFRDTALFSNIVGINSFRQAFVHLEGATEVRDNMFDGMRLVQDSGAVVDDPVSIPPNGSGTAVSCDDTESSLDNRSTRVGPTNCTDFNSQ